ncbi:SMI1/KNR4 family protein [Bacillus wiedmannii]|uniref:SMI1/KNR4 family protein n=1 Tax=Bacillus wiedmannii TaxID=1890302 RepID=A0A242Z7S4_9BACI|nr:SMI1/KNR4 family protein [Bacillus wiedmannii]MED3122634.1 SMI1/KNR4 family protein [Bacillus wiedmannii]OTX88791.1 SMI1/KNR4 family protein [Bacillus wiedmannii]OUB45604.1 SMI1/KNR4 family protein [Bacillus thuringiensis serovar argentinensis]
MDQKLTYLKRYNKNVRILTIDEISRLGDNEIPIEWRELFYNDDIKGRIDLLLNIWGRNVGTELRNTISYLNKHLTNVEILDVEGAYSILYTIRNSKGDILYYEGCNPQKGQKNIELEDAWDKIPASIRSFYENVHDGFYYYASESMGLVPLELVTYLGNEDIEWSIIDDLEESIKINLDSSFGFFTNGMGSYVAIDYNNCIDNTATFWSAKLKPKYNIDFWGYVDEWIVIGFEA